MQINKRTTIPFKQPNKSYSMYVFVYYTNNRRFCLGYYDHDSGLWMDNDGMVINDDFIWCYLPIKQMKAYLKSIEENKGIMY